MPHCDASKYAFCVRVPSDLPKGVVDLKDHVGADARAVLDILISRGCEGKVQNVDDDEIGDKQEAVWDGEQFIFYNFFASTVDVANRLNADRGDQPKADAGDIVFAADQGLLTCTKTPNGFFRLILKDEKHDAITFKRVKDRPPVVRSGRKIRGRGLKKMVWKAIQSGHIPNSFGVKEVKKGLLALNWREGNHYSEKSVLSAIVDLETEGQVFLKSGGMVKDRVWGVTTSQVSSTVLPSPKTVSGQIDHIVESLAGEIAARAEKRAKEMLGL